MKKDVKVKTLNSFLNGLKTETNYTYTENGAVTHKSTLSKLYDMFALGGAMRSRSENDIISMFEDAFRENPLYALKCLFYLRDREEGQGERRFFRTVIRYMASAHPEEIRRNIQYIPLMGRWDDLYAFDGTPLEQDAYYFMKKQLVLDLDCATPSLLAKWLKSENASSSETAHLAKHTRKYFGMSARQYRKTLSYLRQKINVLERLMSENRWDEIEFDKIPSRAGILYRNAFARHDLQRAKSTRDCITYEEFAKSKDTKVNARVLYPYECVAEVWKNEQKFNSYYYGGNGREISVAAPFDDTQRLMINKYWDNLTDYFQKATFNAMAIVDTSGSMCRSNASAPINVAVSLGLYCDEKSKGPFANHFITFSSNPTFIETSGVDFYEKVVKMGNADWGGSTNLEAAFDMMLDTAIKYNCSQDEIPQNLIVISDMEFNACASCGTRSHSRWGNSGRLFNETLMETIRNRWLAAGYKMPNLVFWNVDARQNNIPMRNENGITFVSGMSPVIYEMIMSGKTAEDLMMDKLNSERYAMIK